jgi:hypothetical protein
VGRRCVGARQTAGVRRGGAPRKAVRSGEVGKADRDRRPAHLRSGQAALCSMRCITNFNLTSFFYQLLLMVRVFLKTIAAFVALAGAQSAATIIGPLNACS